MDFTVTSDHRVKLKENEKLERYVNLARELKNLWKMKVTIIPIVVGAQGFGKSIRGLGNKRTSGDNPNSSIVEID